VRCSLTAARENLFSVATVRNTARVGRSMTGLRTRIRVDYRIISSNTSFNKNKFAKSSKLR
jgi:hypothetical protein